MSIDNQTQSLHHVQWYILQDRVSHRNLSNSQPIGDVSKLPLSSFLLNKEKCNNMRDNYATLIGRVIISKLSYFEKPFKDCVPKHITHKYSEEMSQVVGCMLVSLIDIILT